MKTLECWRTLPQHALLVSISAQMSSKDAMPWHHVTSHGDRQTHRQDQFYTLDRWHGREKTNQKAILVVAHDIVHVLQVFSKSVLPPITIRYETAPRTGARTWYWPHQNWKSNINSLDHLHVKTWWYFYLKFQSENIRCKSTFASKCWWWPVWCVLGIILSVLAHWPNTVIYWCHRKK